MERCCRELLCQGKDIIEAEGQSEGQTLGLCFQTVFFLLENPDSWSYGLAPSNPWGFVWLQCLPTTGGWTFLLLQPSTWLTIRGQLPRGHTDTCLWEDDTFCIFRSRKTGSSCSDLAGDRVGCPGSVCQIYYTCVFWVRVNWARKSQPTLLWVINPV